MRRWLTRKRLSGLVLPLVILALWQAASLAYATPLFPGPASVLLAMARSGPMILGQLGYTLMRAAEGFVAAAVLMIPLGIVLGRFRAVGRIIEPIVDMLATLPPPAIVPLVMLFAGTGDGAKVVIIAYAAAIPLLINTYEASLGIHPMLSRVARTLHLTRLETMRDVDLPASLPMIATGVRLAIASSLLVSITSEMLLATNGIGVYLQRAQENFSIDAGLAGIAFISIVGVIINALVFKAEQRWLFWHYRDTRPME